MKILCQKNNKSEAFIGVQILLQKSAGCLYTERSYHSITDFYLFLWSRVTPTQCVGYMREWGATTKKDSDQNQNSETQA